MFCFVLFFAAHSTMVIPCFMFWTCRLIPMEGKKNKHSESASGNFSFNCSAALLGRLNDMMSRVSVIQYHGTELLPYQSTMVLAYDTRVMK